MLKKRGFSTEKIAGMVELSEKSSADVDVEIGGGLSVRKWENHPSEPLYSENSLSPLVVLKIVYEFAALLVGGAIYDAPFQPIRDILRESDEDFAFELLVFRRAHRSEAIHGIAFEGNNPQAQFQVRLFGLTCLDSSDHD